jgi:hypothetical protein
MGLAFPALTELGSERDYVIALPKRVAAINDPAVLFKNYPCDYFTARSHLRSAVAHYRIECFLLHPGGLFIRASN